MFLNSFQEIGDALKRAQERYEQSVKHLAIGKGNLIKRAEELKAIGVSGKKQIPSNLLEQCGLDPHGNEVSPTKIDKDGLNGELK